MEVHNEILKKKFEDDIININKSLKRKRLH